MSILPGIAIFPATDRKQADYDAFADRCAGKGMPIDTFFPSNATGGTAAKKLCKSCPVRQECLNYALNNEEAYGVWGGLDGLERKAIIRQRAPVA